MFLDLSPFYIAFDSTKFLNGPKEAPVRKQKNRGYWSRSFVILLKEYDTYQTSTSNRLEIKRQTKRGP